MRLLSATLVLAMVFVVFSKMTYQSPRILYVQVNRCPSPEIYSNFNEESEVQHPEEWSENTIVHSEFEETLRFMANESGTLQFFVVGEGIINFVISADENVLSGTSANVDLDAPLGGVLISRPFHVVKGVRETIISVTMITDTVSKTTDIFASTKSLEPPRPPSNQDSHIFTSDEAAEIERHESDGAEVNHDNTELSEGFPTVESSGTQIDSSRPVDMRLENSPVKIRYEKYPMDVDSNGTPIRKARMLRSIALNRLSGHRMDVYGNNHQHYQLNIKKSEHGQLIFNVSGRGKIRVYLTAVNTEMVPWKVIDVVNSQAVLQYSDGVDTVERERLVAFIRNDLGDQEIVYLTMARVN